MAPEKTFTISVFVSSGYAFYLPSATLIMSLRSNVKAPKA